MGLFLKHVQQVTPSSEAWVHTVIVPLPNRDFLPYNKVNNKSNSLAMVIEESNQRLQKRVCGRNDSAECQQFEKHIKFTIEMVRDKVTFIQNLLSAIHDIIPTADLRYDNFRPSRSLIPQIGSILEQLFGVATTSSVRILAQQIHDSKKLENHQLNIIQNTTRHMATFIKLSEERLDAMMTLVSSSVKEMSRLISDMQIFFNQQIQFLNLVTWHTFQMNHYLD